MTHNEIKELCSRITLELFGKVFNIRVAYDGKHRSLHFNDPKGEMSARTFIQITYLEKCNKGGEEQEWRGRKWYLSEYMIADEIVKTVYAAFKATIDHECMESFKVDGVILFNPHINFEELLKVSQFEVKR